MCYRSSDETLEFLLKFKHIETTKPIQEQLISKFSYVMKQFMNETLSVQTEFDVRRLFSILCIFVCNLIQSFKREYASDIAVRR